MVTNRCYVVIGARLLMVKGVAQQGKQSRPSACNGYKGPKTLFDFMKRSIKTNLKGLIGFAGNRHSKLMYLRLKCIFCLCLQTSVGCERYKCYNNGRCVGTCHGDMFYCQCTQLYRGKQCERAKGTRPDGYCLKYVTKTRPHRSLIAGEGSFSEINSHCICGHKTDLSAKISVAAIGFFSFFLTLDDIFW